MNPKILDMYIQAHKLKLEEQDTMNWYLGQYVMSALSTALDSMFNGRKAQTKYVNEPFMQNEYFGLTEEEIERKKIDKMIEQELMWMGLDKEQFFQGR